MGSTLKRLVRHCYGPATAVMVLAASMAIHSGTATADGTTVSSTPVNTEVAYLTTYPQAHSGIDLPRVLSDDDVERYRDIFALQEDGHWKKADKLIKNLTDDILMGHVLEQRYMHPKKYRSKYKELKAWMGQYADHPQAPRLYKLALRRRPSNWKYPTKPDLPKQIMPTYDRPEALPRRKLSASKHRRVRKLRYQIRRHAGRGMTLAAKRMVESSEVKKLFSDAQYDEIRGILGFRYFIDGRDKWAVNWAGAAAKRSGNLVPVAHWAAGLASYRLGNMAEAAKYFESMARSDRVSDWLHAASGFWAARSYMKSRNPAMVMPMLEIAAQHSRTFYGILARQMLGRDLGFEWEDLPLQQDAIASLTDSKRGKRAMALVQVGQNRLAEKELRHEASASDDEERSRGILALATNAGMPELALRLDALLFPEGGFDNAAYPVPHWTPEGGFSVDAALVYALIRQESKFNPKAKSWAGASGLMQLMPRTASYVAKDRRYRTSKRKKLYDPTINISLGQRYIEILRDDTKIKGNLVAMVAAWNGGPGNLNKWRRNMDFQNDPLLFIEGIPSRETRDFVEKVLANFWIYRDRLDQPSPSLISLASGAWPDYTSVDARVGEVAAND